MKQHCGVDRVAGGVVMLWSFWRRVKAGGYHLDPCSAAIAIWIYHLNFRPATQLRARYSRLSNTFGMRVWIDRPKHEIMDTSPLDSGIFWLNDWRGFQKFSLPPESVLFWYMAPPSQVTFGPISISKDKFSFYFKWSLKKSILSRCQV